MTGVSGATLSRWCKAWFGRDFKRDRKLTIPPEYLRVVIAWQQVTEPDTREAIRRALVGPYKGFSGSFLVEVDGKVSLWHTLPRALQELEGKGPGLVLSLLPRGYEDGEVHSE